MSPEAPHNPEQAPNPSKGIAEILRGFGEDLGFDEQTCQEISDLPFDEAFETAYGYLMQAGEDPDEILASYIEEEA